MNFLRVHYAFLRTPARRRAAPRPLTVDERMELIRLPATRAGEQLPDAGPFSVFTLKDEPVASSSFSFSAPTPTGGAGWLDGRDAVLVLRPPLVHAQSLSVRADMNQVPWFLTPYSRIHDHALLLSYLRLVPVLHLSCLMYFLAGSCRAFSDRHGLTGTKCSEVLCCSRFY